MSTQKTKWRTLFNPNYLGAWALEEDETIVAKIVKVQVEEVTSPKNEVSSVPVIYLDKGPRTEKNLPMIISAKKNAKPLEAMCKTPHIEDWVGLEIEVFAQMEKCFGELQRVLRIRKPKPVDKELEGLRTECRTLLNAYKGEDRAQLMAGLKANPNSKEVIRDAIAQMKGA